MFIRLLFLFGSGLARLRFGEFRCRNHFLCSLFGRFFLFGLYAYEFQSEDKGRVRLDVFACATLSVSQLIRYVKLPFRAYRHHLQGLSPALDESAHAENIRFRAVFCR